MTMFLNVLNAQPNTIFLNMRKETPYIMPVCAEPASKAAFCMQRISPVLTARAPSFSPA